MTGGTFFRTDRFMPALAILAVSAVFMFAAKRAGWLILIKKPLPIRRPLIDFDRDRLLPYRVVSAQSLPEDVVYELGTEEYLYWSLKREDAAIPAARDAFLAVTYYTGVQDQVPHVPEECLNVAGFAIQSNDVLAFGVVAGDRSVPVRRQLFTPPAAGPMPGTGGKRLVYYTFGVNGEFRADRNSVRRKMLVADETHLYYSKVELMFTGVRDGSVGEFDPVASALMRAVLEELIESHWPPAGLKTHIRQ